MILELIILQLFVFLSRTWAFDFFEFLNFLDRKMSGRACFLLTLRVDCVMSVCVCGAVFCVCDFVVVFILIFLSLNCRREITMGWFCCWWCGWWISGLLHIGAVWLIFLLLQFHFKENFKKSKSILCSFSRMTSVVLTPTQTQKIKQEYGTPTYVYSYERLTRMREIY